jgi:hypothetical protein
LRAIEKLANALQGEGAVTLRLRPFIIGVSNPEHIQLIKDAANAGASSISTEFFCLETRTGETAKENYRKISEHCGFDIHSYYKRNSKGAGYLRLNKRSKRRFVEEMESACRESGIGFYVSDAHFKERSDSGCCCGMTDAWPWSRGQLCEGLQIAKEKGQVRFSDIAGEMKFMSQFGYRNAEGMNTRNEEHRSKFVNMSLYDFLRYNWNTPRLGQSPAKFYGKVLVPVAKDENGDLVYEYREGEKK